MVSWGRFMEDHLGGFLEKAAERLFGGAVGGLLEVYRISVFTKNKL